MKNLFQNKFMITLIIISILLVGTTSFISVLGYTSYIRNAIGIALTPVQNGIDDLLDGAEGFFAAKKDYQKLKEENEKLKKELAESADILAKAELAISENEELKEYLGIKQEHTDITFENAEVTGRQNGSHLAVYTLNKGTYHGIEPGMAVIDEYGIVGCITETGLTWSKAEALTQPGISIGTAVERTGKKGVSSGTFTSSKEGLCVISYLDSSNAVNIGDRIITSNDSSRYPAGLLVGTVEKTEYDPLSRELKAWVSPASNLAELKTVMIITDYENVYE